MARFKGGLLTVTYDTNKRFPLDSRMLVSKYEDLINPSIWKTSGLSTNALFNGLITAVNAGEHSGIYFLINWKDITDENYANYLAAVDKSEATDSYFRMWSKLAEIDELDSLEARIRELEQFKHVSSEELTSAIDGLRSEIAAHYVTQEQLSTEVIKLENIIETNKVTTNKIVETLATKQELADAVSDKITANDLTDYATKTFVAQELENLPKDTNTKTVLLSVVDNPVNIVDSYDSTTDTHTYTIGVNVYSKEESDNRYLKLEDKYDDSNIKKSISDITITLNALSDNVKDNYYTKKQTDEQILLAVNDANHLIKKKISDVNTAENLVILQGESIWTPAKDNVIYLKLAATLLSDNYYEYTIIDGKLTLIGSTSADLSNYYTKDETYSKLEVSKLVETKIERIKVGSQILTPMTEDGVKVVDIPLATKEQAGVIKSGTHVTEETEEPHVFDNEIVIDAGGIARIERVNISTLVQTDDEILYLNGGNA